VRPNPLSQFHRLRSNVLLAPPFFLALTVCGCLAFLASLVDKHGRLQQRIARLWGRASVFFAGARVQVIGLENVPAAILSRKHAPAGHACAVFAANHTSYMDTPVIFANLPFQFRILAKKELWGIPFIGWYLSRSGQLPIDTANPRATLSSLGAAARTLRAGLSVFVFPEGARTPDRNLKPFLNGAAFLALRAQVPLVPIALIGVYDLLPIHTRHLYPSRTPIKLVFGVPIPTAGRSPRESESLTDELRQAIQSLIDTHSLPATVPLAKPLPD
jgi:1-acyl-sn-glycerol-3-phosphate acyltransferase